jgi:hypothetical protein
VAAAHSIIVIAYHMLGRQQVYADLDSNYFDELHKERVRDRLTSRLEVLGYRVRLKQPG